MAGSALVVPAFAELHDYQDEVYAHPARFKVLAAGRRWGKTRLGVVACLETAGRDGGLAWWVAPTYKDTEPGWYPLRAIAKDLPGCEIREGDRTIRFANGGAVMVRSADDPHERGLRGHALDLVVCDEAAQFQYPDAWTHALRPALSDRGGRALFISTPRGYNWFFDLYQRAQDLDDWQAWQFPTTTNPFFDQAELEDARRELGSLTFAQEFLAEFIQPGGNRYKPEWFRRFTFDQHYARTLPSESWPDEDLVDMRKGVRFCTVDLATSTKTSADYTVIASCVAVGHRLLVLEVYRRRLEGPDIIPAISEQMGRWDLSVAYIEKVGFQLSLIQAAQKQGLPVKELRPETDKIGRSVGLEARMEAGDVWFNRGDWFTDMERELLAFPEAGHDDQVDALAYAAKVMSELRQKPKRLGDAELPRL